LFATTHARHWRLLVAKRFAEALGDYLSWSTIQHDRAASDRDGTV